MLNSNLFSDLNYYERFAKYFNCTESHNRFLLKFQKPSLKKLKKKKLKIFLDIFFDALHGGIAKKMICDHRSSFGLRAP